MRLRKLLESGVVFLIEPIKEAIVAEECEEGIEAAFDAAGDVHHPERKEDVGEKDQRTEDDDEVEEDLAFGFVHC